MRPYILHETNWHTVREMHFNTAILPWGATEAHNYHLPYGTDTILAGHLAEESAALAWEKGTRALVLPAVPFGVNTGQLEVPFCMNMNPSTQMALLEDVITVLLRHGVDHLIIMNGHGGNIFQPIVRELGMKFPKMLLCVINWWKICPASDYFQKPGDHADEMETSSIMAIRPDLVLPLDFAGRGEEKHFAIKGLREKWAWMPRRWVYVTRDTGVGDPSTSTPAKGARFVKDCIEKAAGFISDFAAVTSEKDLYES